MQMNGHNNNTNFMPFGEDAQTSGSKFLLDCQALITTGWLDSVQGLRLIHPDKALGMRHKKILEAVFHRRRRVVVKIADVEEDLSVEWNTYEALSKAGVARANILTYFCYFRCADNLPQICQGIGDSMQVLVMEHVDGRCVAELPASGGARVAGRAHGMRLCARRHASRQRDRPSHPPDAHRLQTRCGKHSRHLRPSRQAHGL